MKIKIYTIGKIKEEYLKEGINEYLKRLTPYTNIEIIEVKDESIKNNPNDKDIENAKNVEGEKILKLLKSNEYLISLDLDKSIFKRKTSGKWCKYFFCYWRKLWT